MERREAMDINIVLRGYGLPSTEIEALSAHEKSQMMNAFRASEHDKEHRSNLANSRADRNHNNVVQKDCVVVIEQLTGEVDHGRDRAKLENGNPRKRTFSDLDDGFELKASKNTRLSLKKNERSDIVEEHRERTSPDKKMLPNKKDELPSPCRQSLDSHGQRNNLDHSSRIEGKSVACVSESSGPLVRKYRINAIDPRPLITPDGCDWREHSKVVLQYFNNWAGRYHEEQSRILTRVAWGKPIDVKIARPRQKSLSAAHTAAESSVIVTESLSNDANKIEVDQSTSDGNKPEVTEIDERVEKVSNSDSRPCNRRQTTPNRTFDDDQGWLSKKDLRGNALKKRAATRDVSDERSDTTDEVGDSDSNEDFVMDQMRSKRKMIKIQKKSDAQQSEKTKKTFRRFFKPVDKKEDPVERHGDEQVTSSGSPVFIDLEPVTDLQRYLTGNSSLLDDTQVYNLPESYDAIDSGFSHQNEVNRPELSNPVSGTIAKDDDSDTVEIQSDDEGQALPPLKLVRPSIHQFKFQPRVQTPEPQTNQQHQNIQQCPMCLKDVPADDYMTHVPRCVNQCGS